MRKHLQMKTDWQRTRIVSVINGNRQADRIDGEGCEKRSSYRSARDSVTIHEGKTYDR